MVTTRGKNATTDSNPSVTKFTKEQNDFKMKQCQQYAAKEPLDQYELNLYVLHFNYNSTITELNKAYRSMARRFHPEKNIELDATLMMRMINTAKFGLLYLLRENYQIREEENVQAAEDEESDGIDSSSSSAWTFSSSLTSSLSRSRSNNPSLAVFIIVYLSRQKLIC